MSSEIEHSSEMPFRGFGSFLLSSISRLSDYKNLCDKAFRQLNEEDFHFTPYQECNSIAIIIQHMHGNMLSRWTDFLTSDGEKKWRQRDAEFEEQKLSKDELLTLWDEGWKCVFAALNKLTENDLQKTVYIRSEPYSVTDAINRQLAHYSYHVGQIIYAARIIKNKNWQSLSIPKGQSATFNNLKRLS
ncbi:MAG: DUF1572 domain-containing protein [Bacteroidota bacterium]|nr:DUF1572 domain-containing protein [Bacteroidota bacterium]